MKMLLLLLASLTLVSWSCGENPGIQLTLTDRGLQTLRHFAAGLVQDQLDEVSFPDVRGSMWRILQYSLTGMQLVKCDLPEPSVHFSPGTSGLVLSLSGLCVALSGNWTTHWAFGDNSGGFELAVFDLSVSSSLKLDRDQCGRLSLSSLSCEAGVKALELQFHGKTSWVTKKLEKYLKTNLKDRIQRSICPWVEEAVSRLEQHLQAMNVSVPWTPVMNLQLPLTAPPDVHSKLINFGLKGEFLSVETQHQPPFVAPPFSLATPSNVMMSVGVSEYSLNSASFAYFDSGHLQTLLNDSMIPPSCPLRLNTSSWGPYIPQLPQMFPDLAMTLQVYARQFPNFSFEPGVVRLKLLSSAKASAVLKNSTVCPLFTLNLDSAVSVKLSVGDGKVKGLMRMDNFTLTLDSSEIGPFKTDALQNLAEAEAQCVVEKINVKLQEGFDLPQTKHMQLLNSVLTVEQGFIAFFSDAKLQSIF